MTFEILRPRHRRLTPRMPICLPSLPARSLDAPSFLRYLLRLLLVFDYPKK